MPIGAMLATERVAQGFEPGSHASTFGGNPLATGVALEVLRVLVEERLPERAEHMGRLLVSRLEALALKYLEALGGTRGRGLMIGVELKLDGTELLREAMNRGLLINVVGTNVMRLLPR